MDYFECFPLGRCTKLDLIHGVILLCGVLPSHVAVRRYKFELRNTSYSRLCSNKTMLTINGQFPGPTIYARKGDLVIVDVYNLADHNITIHWHGVKQPRYPWSDGPEYVTQCPIRPGTKFTQLRVILSDEEGTLWWHAQSKWSRATVLGALVVLPQKRDDYPFPKPDAEVPIILGDWWKSDVQQVMEEFLRTGGDPKVSDAFRINGQPGDQYPCSRQDTFKVTAEYGKTYLFRMVNSVMNNIMFFKIANHNITVVGSAEATENQQTAITSPSPRDKPSSSCWKLIKIRTSITWLLVYASAGNFSNTTTTGIIEYAGNYTPPSSLILPTFPQFNDTLASVTFTNQLRSLANERYPIDVPLNITDTLLFAISINTRPCPIESPCAGPNDNRLLASVNNITLVLPKEAILQAYYKRISGVYDADFPDNPPFPYNYTQDIVPGLLWTPENGTDVNVLEYNSTVELVFQGTNIVGGVDHPMHLHGYSFYVVGSVFGNFNRSRDPLNYNLVDPPLMETIAVPRNEWTAIRFRADNPGVWFLHCHFERHVSWGMGMAFIVKNGKGPNAKMLSPPPDMPKC